jgi:hypothetical protein
VVLLLLLPALELETTEELIAPLDEDGKIPELELGCKIGQVPLLEGQALPGVSKFGQLRLTASEFNVQQLLLELSHLQHPKVVTAFGFFPLRSTPSGIANQLYFI